MSTMNTGSSPYHAIGALFCRGFQGDLLSVEGRSAEQLAKHWSELRSLVTRNPQKCVTLPSGTQVSTTTVDISNIEELQVCTSSTSHLHEIRELLKPHEDYYVGLISCDLSNDTERDPFRDWIETFVLLETSLRPGNNETILRDPRALRITANIVSLFVDTLKNVASNDEWKMGEGLFRRRVLDFVVRNERIQMALPAFPCKSPSSRKVGGVGPDMAERIALRTLQGFARDVGDIYPPGVAMWIVSDGHVFSDCIGVDDEVVSRYDRAMVDTYQSMFASPEDYKTIRFRGLTDMFFSNHDSQNTFDQQWAKSFHIEHPVQSECSPETELARQIMMAGFQISRDHFRKLIAEQHPPTLSLYRGQARFMQDDLSGPTFLAMSGKQKKKVSFSVAAEMIARNQAYSNLLELLLPNYVRLSIHAHSNRGPKFGICLFPRDQVHAIEAIMDRHALCPLYEFQVPTPWHNSIIKIEGDTMLYVGKAEIVRQAIEHGDFEGGWIDDNVEGGHFSLRPTYTVCPSPSMATESSSASAVYIKLDEKQQSMAKIEAVEMMVLHSPHDVSRVRFGIRLRGKVYRMLNLSRLFAKVVTKDKSDQRSHKRGVAVSSR